MPFAAAHAIERSLIAVARPRRRQSRRTDRQPVLALRRFVRPAHQARVADDLVACERDERSAGQRRLLAQPAVDLDVEPLDRHVFVALLRERPRLAQELGADSIETNSTPSKSRGSRAPSSSTCFTSRRVSSKPKRRAKAIERSSSPATCEPARWSPG